MFCWFYRGVSHFSKEMQKQLKKNNLKQKRLPPPPQVRTANIVVFLFLVFFVLIFSKFFTLVQLNTKNCVFPERITILQSQKSARSGWPVLFTREPCPWFLPPKLTLRAKRPHLQGRGGVRLLQHGAEGLLGADASLPR